MNILPTSTFFNLPEEKKKRVIEAALDEFAAYPYHKASVTRIIKRAKIASGSFYQYFKDKKDLYKYILELGTERKFEYLGPVLEKQNEYDFFELLRQLYVRGIKYARENPRLEAIANKLISNKDSEIYVEIIGEQRPRTARFFRALLEDGIKKGEIDSEVDIDLVAHMLITLNLALSDFVYKDGKVDMDDMVLIDKMLYVIENGIKNKSK
ncbi:TetR/AcrR family transcriptional regulator [Halothermothrix orenii]|uniref:TetR/AcrR family transcriptional regulator n=1 Tax=Halothermothrix orenii TaxID=31909 RepID=UPI003D07D315